MSQVEQQSYGQKLCGEAIKKYKEGNPVEAIKLWKAAAENKSTEAKYCIALQHISGKYIQKDLNNAIKLLEEASNEGYEKATYTLADIYEKGAYGIEQNHDKALAYCKKFIDTKKPEAIKFVMKIAHKYEREVGISMVNNAVAVRYYELCAEAGDIEAIMKAADLHSTGIGRMFDRTKAVHYYEVAAKRGVIEAIESMSNIYLKGLYDVPKDDEKYVMYITKLAELQPENKKYQKKYLDLYIDGKNGVPQDHKKVMEILAKLAKLDVNDGYYKYLMAEAYEKGEYSVEVDTKRAVELYFDLINRYPENEMYQLKMADIFEEGKFGVKQEKNKAAKIYANLVARFPSNPLYQYKLGKINYDNKDPESQKLAYQCFARGYELGDRLSGYYVAELLFVGGAKFPKDYGRANEITDKIKNKIKDSHVLTIEEQILYRSMIVHQIQMLAKGGPKLAKNVARAKEVLNEFNDHHEDRIKLHL